MVLKPHMLQAVWPRTGIPWQEVRFHPERQLNSAE